MPPWRNVALAVLVAVCAFVLHAEIDERVFRSSAREALVVSALESLANASQSSAGNMPLTPSEIRRFELDGFLIVRGAIDPAMVTLLFENKPRGALYGWLAPLGTLYQWFSSSFISVDMIWSESALFRRFWFRGSIPRLVSQLNAGKPVRMLCDIVYGIPRGARPLFLGQWHKDSTSFDIVERETANGISAWIPLVDIDAETNGGSIYMGNISRVSPECQAMPDDSPSEACIKHLDTIGQAHSYKRGDVLLFTEHTFHRSQPLRGDGTAKHDRFALVGRFVDADAIFMESRGAEQQRKNACPHGLSEGQRLHSPCFPQVWPSDEQRETEAATMATTIQAELPSAAFHLFNNLKRILA